MAWVQAFIWDVAQEPLRGYETGDKNGKDSIKSMLRTSFSLRVPGAQVDRGASERHISGAQNLEFPQHIWCLET